MAEDHHSDPLVREVSARPKRELPGALSPEGIKDLRRSLGMTQPEFAEAVGASSSVTVCRWENGVSRPHRMFVKEMLKLQRKQRS